jgi:hypothetical protein
METLLYLGATAPPPNEFGSTHPEKYQEHFHKHEDFSIAGEVKVEPLF